MVRKRYSPEQINTKLRKAQVLLSQRQTCTVSEPVRQNRVENLERLFDQKVFNTCSLSMYSHFM